MQLVKKIFNLCWGLAVLRKAFQHLAANNKHFVKSSKNSNLVSADLFKWPRLGVGGLRCSEWLALVCLVSLFLMHVVDWKWSSHVLAGPVYRVLAKFTKVVLLRKLFLKKFNLIYFGNTTNVDLIKKIKKHSFLFIQSHLLSQSLFLLQRKRSRYDDV